MSSYQEEEDIETSISSSIRSSPRSLCRPKLRLQIFRRSGVNLVLIYNFFTSLVVQYLVARNSDKLNIVYSLTIAAMFTIVASIFPIIGWLADTRCSRYCMISFSMKIIWATAVLYVSLSSIYIAEYGRFHSLLKYALFIVIIAGSGGFLSNIIQFSIDQLYDASSSEILAFLMWYIWTYFFGYLIVNYTQVCVCGEHALVAKLLFPLALSIVLCLDFLCNSWLVKEPVTSGPFKLMFKILKYVIKNKYPRQRSAFTYWEDKQYSRIDLAKSKYGGPFTTEQVEDVKTVLRIITFMIIMSGVVGFWLNIDSISINYFQNGDSIDCDTIKSKGGYLNCMKQLSVRCFGYVVITIFVPVHELFIFPLFWKYILQMNSIFKLNASLLCLICYYSVLTVMEAVGYHSLPENDKANLTCFLGDPTSHIAMNYKWLYLPQVVSGFGRFYLVYAVLEFICARAPYSTKGLLVGFLYGLLCFSWLFFSLLLLPIHLTADKWSPVPYGCGMWFYLIVVLVLLLYIILELGIARKLIKMRRRDEVLHNEHIFAIDYFNRYVGIN